MYESYRQSCGLSSIAQKCFEAANISVVLIDDGIKFDKMHNWEWHSGFVLAVGRILRIEHEAEAILNEVRNFFIPISLMFPLSLWSFS